MAPRMRCYFELSFGGRSAGRLEFELFDDVLPRTCENFKCLCTGERGGRLSYASSSFHRVIRNFMIQGGDFTRGDGTGGESIYGSKFADEGFPYCHDAPYLLSMANAGPNTNGSQFFITLRNTPHLDGRHVVFGKCVSGIEIVDAIAKVAVDESDRPLVMVTIAACGLVQDTPTAAVAATATAEEGQEGQAIPLAAAARPEETVVPEEEEDEEEEEEEEVLDEAALEGKSAMEVRLLKLRMAMNKGRKANASATRVERARTKDPKFVAKQRAEERGEQRRAWREELKSRGVDESKAYLLETAETAGRRTAKLSDKAKKKAAFGWDVFNADSLHRAYDKRTENLPTGDNEDDGDAAALSLTGPLEYGTAPPPSEAALDRMAAELGDRAKAREKFSRRRPDVPGADVDFINDRNKVFNKKIKRAFDKYTVEIRQNIERGTAI